MFFIIPIPGRRGKSSATANLSSLIALFGVFGFILFLFGIISLVAAFNQDFDELYNVSEISNSEMEFGELYKIDELYVLDCYCTEESDKDITYYCLVTFVDKDQEFSVATLVVDKYDDIYDQVEDFIKDPNAYWGDLTLSCYVSRRNLPTDDSIQEYYENLKYDLVTTGYFSDYEFKDLAFAYRYDGSYTAEDMAKEEKDSSVLVANACLIASAVCIVFAVLFFFKLKKTKEALASQNNGYDYREYLNRYQECNSEK